MMMSLHAGVWIIHKHTFLQTSLALSLSFNLHLTHSLQVQFWASGTSSMALFFCVITITAILFLLQYGKSILQY